MATHFDIAKEVIELEISGLNALKKSIGDEFDQCITILSQTSGRIVVTGMGKSGHVARKIAATFSSTGSPSMFVHPGEASHGDLGMISPNDVILALSNSGETNELRDLLAYAARFTIPVIAITSKTNSALAKAATATLTIPDAKEACGETRAPTTSTTMMMVAGDALAVALLRDRGFTAKDFHGFHPGGNLGAALRRVSDLMHGADHVPLCAETANMTEVVEVISNGKFGCVGIVDAKDHLIGVITDGDLRRHFNNGLKNSKASDIMTSPPCSTEANALAGDALALMSRDKITALFVVEDQRPVGIVHVHDCLSTGVL